MKLELGGKGAAVIFDDVDIPEAADKLAQAITFHTGQVCCDATRWLVQKSIYDDFVNAAVERLKAIQIGHPLGQATQMGPVVSDIQYKRVLGYLEKGTVAGAETVLEGGAAQIEVRRRPLRRWPAAGRGKRRCTRGDFWPGGLPRPVQRRGEGIRFAIIDYGQLTASGRNLARCKRVAFN